MTSPLPSDRAQRTRTALIIAISVLALLVVGMGAWALFKPHPKPARQTTITPAEETSASVVPSAAVSSVPASETTGSSGATTSVGGAAPSGPSPGIPRAPKVAFRLGGSLYVAGEDGSAAKAVVRSAEGPYALSPDGRTLALVEAGKLKLVNVEGSAVTSLGAAESVSPVWMPDSSAVLYVQAGADSSPQVVRAGVAGGGPKPLGPGVGAAVSPDGTIVVLLGVEGSGGPALSISRLGGAFLPLTVGAGTPLGVAVANDRIYVSTLTSAGVAAVYTHELNGARTRPLVVPGSAATKATTFGRLLLSPDGRRLLYAAESDDGYSRMWTVPTSGGTATALFPRRDNYPVQWTVDGGGVLFIEGNAFQGEPTALYRANPDGTRRVMLVSGAFL